ncbi:hypothetical protein [Nocardia abscessus]|nr:hypothetical protein [Nocardia abscessus]
MKLPVAVGGARSAHQIWRLLVGGPANESSALLVNSSKMLLARHGGE